MKCLVLTFAVLFYIQNIQFILTYDISIGKVKYRQIIGRDLVDNSYVSKVDHFRIQKDDSAVLNYIIMNDFYQPGGPIFLYISDGRADGNEFFSFSAGLVYNVSQEVHAALVTTDLRYFWYQRVTPSLSVKDLTNLTVEQILADISLLITNIKRVLDAPAAKVVLYGPGFGGTLAVWARQKFPQLIDGVWSSSGIFSSGIFTNDAYSHFSDVIESAPPTCVNRIREAFEEIEDHIQNGNGEYLQESLYLCNPVDHTSELNIARFYEVNIELIISFFDTYRNNALELFCSYMVNETHTPFEAYAYWIAHYYLYQCLDMSYEPRIHLIANEGWNQNIGVFLLRQMYYLKCTQLGLFKTTTPNENIFRAVISQHYHFTSCHDIFGENYKYNALQPNLERMFLEYGERNPKITGVIFTNGLNDPWLPHGMLEYDQPNSIVINITNFGRAADMFTIDLEDPAMAPTLQQIREYFLWWSTPEIDPNEIN